MVRGYAGDLFLGNASWGEAHHLSQRMNRRILISGGLAAIAAAAGVTYFYLQARRSSTSAAPAARVSPERLVRAHAPVFGPANAPVTMVEFFDPSCEACRAFYPFVKQILSEHPKDVRLVLRYAPFHQGSDEAVMILEAARTQGKYEATLEALLQRQPEWAIHGAPNLPLAWLIAKEAGLDIQAARAQIAAGAFAALLKQDTEDLNALEVHRTPTFYVNGVLLESVGPKQLYELVRQQMEQGGSAASK